MMELDRFEWLARTTEAALDSGQRIVDPHHHLWARATSTYLAPELLADITGSHNISRTVFVECGSGYDTEGPEPMRPVGETRFVADQARATEAAGGPVIAGIVSHADMMLGARVEPVLAAHEEAGGGRFRGIRHGTSWDASDEVYATRRQTPGIMTTPEFRAGVRTLAAMGHSFDAWLFHPQLPELAALARDVPELTIVLDHAVAPLAVGPYRSRRDEARRVWRASIQDVAACPNVVLKVGGIGMDVYYGTGWADRPAPPGSEEVAARWGDDVRRLIDLFGPERCMFESNFPVDRATLPYPVLWNSFQIMASAYDAAEQAHLFSDTATRIYRLT